MLQREFKFPPEEGQGGLQRTSNMVDVTMVEVIMVDVIMVDGMKKDNCTRGLQRTSPEAAWEESWAELHLWQMLKHLDHHYRHHHRRCRHHHHHRCPESEKNRQRVSNADRKVFVSRKLLQHVHYWLKHFRIIWKNVRML